MAVYFPGEGFWKIVVNAAWPGIKRPIGGLASGGWDRKRFDIMLEKPVSIPSALTLTYT